METQTIINSAIIMALVAGFAIVGVTDKEPTHYCEDKQLKAYCYDFSSTMRTCYTLPAKAGGKLCGAEWKEIPFVPEEIKVAKAGIAEKIVCSPSGCTP